MADALLKQTRRLNANGCGALLACAMFRQAENTADHVAAGMVSERLTGRAEAKMEPGHRALSS